jgi:hypothetical protein
LPMESAIPSGKLSTSRSVPGESDVDFSQISCWIEMCEWRDEEMMNRASGRSGNA